MVNRKIIIFILVISVVLNIVLVLKQSSGGIGKHGSITFPGANTRDTYNTIHHVKKAHKISTGKGIKVGIIGKYFGFMKHKELYKQGIDFLGEPSSLNEYDQHGYWMAVTLREIAPDVEIFALNARSTDKDLEAIAIVNAVDWAIENNLDILTYSAQAFKIEHREIIDKAVTKAIANGIVTTFIHYPHPDNILPYATFQYTDGEYSRKPDLNIYHYDYNTFLMIIYNRYLKSNKKPMSGNDIPYFSFSSMSPVLAGFVALLKEIDNSLPASEYKNILIETSNEIDQYNNIVENVVDIDKAVNELKKRISKTVLQE